MSNLEAKRTAMESMTTDELRLCLQEEAVHNEEQWLERMIQSNKEDDADIQDFTAYSRKHYRIYTDDGNQNELTIAENYLKLVEHIKAGKYTISDIRKQRERVQWERKKLQAMQQEGRSPSSSRSKN